VLPSLGWSIDLSLSQGDALQLFAKRLGSRSLLSGEEQSAVLSLQGQIKQVPAHKDFVHLGEVVDHACLLVEGFVGRFGQNGEGLRQLSCLHIAGDMADLVSLVSPKTGWGLTALTDVTILRVPHRELRRVAVAYPAVAEAFWRDCVADGSIFSEWVVNVGRRDAIARLSHLLCEMALRCERAGLGSRQSFRLPLTQADLADATGMTGIHVNRTLKALRTQSIVSMYSGTVTVHDWDALVRVGDFDPAYMLLDGPAPRILETI
jgi:CRP-like cAMP-binding protein